MNTLLKEGMELARAVEKLENEKTSDALVIIAPPYTHLSKVKDMIENLKVQQNLEEEIAQAESREQEYWR